MLQLIILLEQVLDHPVLPKMPRQRMMRGHRTVNNNNLNMLMRELKLKRRTKKNKRKMDKTMAKMTRSKTMGIIKIMRRRTMRSKTARSHSKNRRVKLLTIQTMM